ncbi:MAG TPA: AAA domain-containing protein [Xanthobacteraceae bacterium]|nr:AAA domain-containing protein [Xanthobacteraceae bacterium]
MAEPRQKLVSLLDYIEQVVRLDERVAFRLADYKLADGSTFAVSNADTRDLPGIRHDLRDEEGPIWLEVERLSRNEPPSPPKDLADWIALSPDPEKRPEIRARRVVTVSAAERDEALASGEVRPEDVLDTPRRRDETDNSPPRFDLTLRLEDRPDILFSVERWIDETWTNWSAGELPRRRTIALYQKLYRIFQLIEMGGAESPIELIWGIGVVHWQKAGILLDRPLLERRVEIELDDRRGGLIRIRPTSAEALFDLKPYEEMGCTGLPGLSDLIRREIERANEDEGISPFVRESFETVLSSAGARLDGDGRYVPEIAGAADAADPARLTVTDRWVLFARPRSQHVVLQDIDRLRRYAENEANDIGGLAQRLVTEPSDARPSEAWTPLSTKIGDSLPGVGPAEEKASLDDVFFPKPFNDDQIEIVRRLSAATGLVVQGPPGTGKTHTIANLICHAMATGQRVLVVSRGESALSVLKDQLPEEVRPLAIAVLSNERQGLRQIESAIREIQSVVESTQPANRRLVIAGLEREIQGLQDHVRAVDREIDQIAQAHLAKLGPRTETPDALARRIVAEREAFQWFVDRPARFAAETDLSDSDMAALSAARRRAGEWIDHLGVALPAPADLPDVETIARWHADLVGAAQYGQAASSGPASSIRVTAANADEAMAVARTLEDLARLQDLVAEARWIEAIWKAAIRGEQDPWCDRLRERIGEAAAINADWAGLLGRAVELPEGLLDDEDAQAAIGRAAGGQRPWPLIALGKGRAKALVAAIKVDGACVRDDDTQAWRHVASVLAVALRQRAASARWDAFANEVGAPSGPDRKAAVEFCQTVLRVCDDVRARSSALASIVADAFTVEALSTDRELCLALARQIGAAATSARLSAVEQDRRRILALFQGGDQTSVLIRQFFEELLGKPWAGAEKITSLWAAVLDRLGEIKARARDFEVIRSVSDAIAAAGAPAWARRLREEAAGDDDPLLPPNWREAWDHAAAEALLARIDQRERLAQLAADRAQAEARCRKLFGALVRERTFYELDRRLSPSIKASLVQFVRALARIGKGTGKSAWIHRRAAREAMSRCYGAVPCWIMPSWRVAEQLPAELAALDLVIIDEASQSDVTELPVLLRGRKILVVGDDRQVSPTAPFVTQQKINQLRHHFLRDLPYGSLLEPGESVYYLMRAVFPNERLMLKEHFRCVEPIVRFSMQFYPEKMLPLRVPTARERIDPPLVDIYVPHGRRSKSRRINEAEAEVIVQEIADLTARPDMRERTVGVISLIGAEQAEFIRARLSETIGEEVMQRHAILCGDSAAFQGTERDIVYLSMVADPLHKTALTMQRYEQRFNVAVSRARDRLVLVRSVKREDLNPEDLKAKLIAHFENPMPETEDQPEDVLARCESGFERDLMRRLIELGYRAKSQVGSLGFRIDIVVEGAGGERLAVECDGDRYHGSEQWAQDMRRQRVLERVGWRFWRCFASSFYRDPDAVLADLLDTLARMGIEPAKNGAAADPLRRHTEHRIAAPPRSTTELPGIDLGGASSQPAAQPATDGGGEPGVALGDKVVVLFSDGSRQSVQLTAASDSLDHGQLSVDSALAQAMLGAEEGDEIELPPERGQHRKALIESIEKNGLHRGAAANGPSVAAATIPARSPASRFAAGHEAHS